VQRGEVVDLLDLLGEQPVQELGEARPAAVVAERAGQCLFLALPGAEDDLDDQAAPRPWTGGSSR
jgi:hypothetical protein